MKQRVRRGLSLLLALAMCLTLLPAGVLPVARAEWSGYPDFGEVTATLTEGNNLALSWTYSTQDNTRYIQGNGLAPDNIVGEIDVWQGTGAKPENNYWTISVSGGRVGGTNVVHVNGGNYSGTLSGWVTSDDTTEPTLTKGASCTIQINILDTNDEYKTVMTTKQTVAVAEASESPEPSLAIGSDEWKAALTPVLDSVEITEVIPYNSENGAKGLVTMGVTLRFPDAPNGRIDQVPGFVSYDVLTNGTHDFGSGAETGHLFADTKNTVPVSDMSDLSSRGPAWIYLNDGSTIFTYTSIETGPADAEASVMRSSESGWFNFAGSADTVEVTVFGEGSGKDASGTQARAVQYAAQSITFSLSDAAEGKTFTSGAPTPAPGPLKIQVTPSKATANKPYTVPLRISGGSGGKLTWSVASGALPAGLSLIAPAADTGNWTISGTPTQAGSTTFTLSVTEENGGADAKELTIAVERASFAVRFRLNGGYDDSGANAFASQQAADGAKVTLTQEKPKRRGWDFDGWRWSTGTGSDEVVYIEEADTLPLELIVVEDNTFTARWAEKAPAAMTYNGELLGSVSLRGIYAGGSGEVTLWSSYLGDTPTVPGTVTINNYYRDSYTFTSLSLYAWVDGEYQAVSTLTGANLLSGGAVTLPVRNTVQAVTGLTVVTADGLTEGTDYTVDSIYNRTGRRYPSIPFLSNGNAQYSVYLYGIYGSDHYKDYWWNHSYDAALSGGKLTVTPRKIELDCTVSGTLGYGSSTDFTPAAGAMVTLSQYAYGRQYNATAYTDANGAFSLKCYQSAGGETFRATYRVYVNNSQIYSGSFDPVAGAMTHALGTTYLNHSKITATLSLNGVSDSDTANRFLAWSGRSLNVSFTGSDKRGLGSKYAMLDRSDTLWLTGAATDETLGWTIDNSYYQPASGEVRLTDGEGSFGAALTPKPAVLLPARSETASRFALAWYNSAGRYLGATRSIYLYNSENTIYSLCPDGGESGSYTVVLVHSNLAGVLEDVPLSAFGEGGAHELDNLYQAEVNVTKENPLKLLPACTVTSVQTENALYITKPNSSLSTASASFSSTGDLIRFDGTIALDEGLTGCTLSGLTIDVTTPEVSWSNSAPVHYLLLDGTLYSMDALGMSSHGVYYAFTDTLTDPATGLRKQVSLPCSFTLYCQPGSVDWDMHVGVYADVTHDGVRTDNQFIGSAVVARPGASIATLSREVCGDTVLVYGVAKAVDGETVTEPETVDIYDDGVLIGSATADRNGNWKAEVPLYGIEMEEGRTMHALCAVTSSGVSSEYLYVFHDENAAELTSFRMAWGTDWRRQEIDAGGAYTFASSMQDVTFTVAFKNPDSLKPILDDGTQVGFVYYLTNGETGFLAASDDDGDGVFTATVDKTLYSSVMSQQVVFSSVDSSEDAVVALAKALAEDEGGREQAMTGRAETLVSGLFGDDDYSLAQAVRNELEGRSSDDSYTVSFTDGKAALSASGAGLSEEDTAEVEAGLLANAEALKAYGIEMQSSSELFGDETPVTEWMENEGASWLAWLAANGAQDANGRQASWSAHYAVETIDATRFQNEIAALDAAAIRHNTLFDTGSEATATIRMDAFVLTDAELDEDGNYSGGTYFATVSAMGDIGSNTYILEAELTLTPDFTGFGDVFAAAAGPVYAAVLRDDPSPDPLKSEPESTSAAQNAVLWLDPLSGHGGMGTGAFNMFYEGKIVGDMSKKAFDAGVKLITENTSSNRVLYKVAEGITAEKAYLSNLIGKTSAFLALVNIFTSSYSWFTSTDYRDQVKYIDQLMSSPGAQKLHDIDKESIAFDRDSLIAFGKQSDSWGWMSWGTGNTGNVAGASGLFSSFISTIKGGLLGTAAWSMGMIFGDQCSFYGKLRDQEYNSILERLRDEAFKNVLKDPNDEDSKALYKELTGVEIKIGTPPGLKPEPLKGSEGGSRYPGGGSNGGSGGNGGSNGGSGQVLDRPINNRVSNDPAGVVFEGVLENPVENAAVTLYYAADSASGVVRQENAALATQLLNATGVYGLIPGSATQTTGADGRYSWGVPEGLWYVTAEAGGLTGNSDADTAATVSKAVGEATKLLPVLPVQLDVNIPLTDTAAPYVVEHVTDENGSVITDEAGNPVQMIKYTTDGVYVTFSKYMVDTKDGADSCLNPAKYTVIVRDKAGNPDKTLIAGTDYTAESMVQGAVPSNLPDAGTTYSRTVLLAVGENILHEGDEILWTVSGDVESYAGTPLGAAYSSSGVVEVKSQLSEPVVTLNGTTKVSDGGSYTVSYGDGVELSLADGDRNVSGAKLRYSTDGGSTWTSYAAPILLTADTTLTFGATAPGYDDSPAISAAFTLSVGGSGGNSGGNNGNGVNNYISGYSGGSGGGSGTANPTVSVPVSGAVPFQSVLFGTTINMELLSDTEAAKLAEAGKGAATIDLSALGKDITAAVIPVRAIRAYAGAAGDKGSLTIRFPDGSATFDAKSLAAILEQAKGYDIWFNLNAVDLSALRNAQRAALKDKDVQQAYDIYLTSDGVSIGDFKDGTVELTLDYTPGSGQNAAGVEVWYASDDGKTLEQIASESDGKTVKTKVSHFSCYAIVYNPAYTKAGENTDDAKAGENTDGRQNAAASCPKDATCPISKFTDASPAAWYHDGVHWALDQGIMGGVSANRFDPNGTATRAQVATMLWRMEGSPASAGRIEYADVSAGAWYAPAVRWASAAGVITGYNAPDGSGMIFAPDAPVTREQLAAMLYRYAQSKGQGFTGAWMFLLDYPDAATVSEWADEAMHWMTMHGIINGIDGKLAPRFSATRAQIATMFMRYSESVK